MLTSTANPGDAFTNLYNSEDVYNSPSLLADENQLRDMKESQMNHQTPRVQDLIAENKMMHENARTLMLEKEELANECQGKYRNKTFSLKETLK